LVLGLIIKTLIIRERVTDWLWIPFMVKLFEILDDNHDYFVYKTFTHKSNYPD
jgi:hypothetical protein